MILKFYRQSLLLAPSSLVLWALLLGFSGFLFAKHQPENAMPVLPFMNAFVQLICSFNWVSAGIATLVIYFEARLINAITFEKELLGHKNKLPHLFYILLFFSTANYAYLHFINFANLFLLLSIREIMNLQYPGSAPSSIFKAGFYLGCSTLFFPLYIYYFPFVVVCLIILKFTMVRAWLIALFGMLTPLIYLWACSIFILEDSSWLLSFTNLIFIDFKNIDFKLIKPTNHFFLMVYLLFLMILSVFATIKIYQLEISRHKYAKQGVLVLAAGAIAITIFAGPMPSNAIGAPVLTILFSFFFSWVKKWWIGEILLYLWIVIIGLYNISYFWV